MKHTLTIGDKLKIVLRYKNITMQELALKMGYNSPSALYNKFKRDNFSEEDLQTLCEYLGCSYKVTISIDDMNVEI